MSTKGLLLGQLHADVFHLPVPRWLRFILRLTQELREASKVPRHNFRKTIEQIFIALCIAAAPATAQEWALPPLADEIAAQFPAIGRLGHAGFRIKQGCTATLIAPDLLLTAAHCLSKKGRSGKVFVAGWSRGEYIASRGVMREMRHPNYALDGAHDPSNDVGLVVLDSPIENVTPILLGEVEQHALYGTEVALFGYHSKTPHLLSGDFNCPVTPFAVGLFHVGCPVINGNSGGPLLGITEAGGWQIVGVVSSQIGAGAIAVELPDWLKQEVAAHLQR
jgi:V8-like Glu-specific endopeptidase